MDTVEVWLVRHGETEANQEGRLSGWKEVALTDCGRKQAEWLRPFLQDERFDGVWSSDLGRALETARLAHGEPRQDERLREIDFGELEGVKFETLDKAHVKGLLAFEGFTAPGGEAIERLTERVNEFLDSLPPGRHLVFTHGGVARSVLRQVGPDRFLPNGTLLVVDWTNRTLLFVHENELGTSSAMVQASERRKGCED